MNVLDWIGVAILGGLGALGRFAVDGLVSARFGRDFPYGTFAINISGAFVLGLLSGAAVTGVEATLAGTATIGSFTTFSTWMFETQRLREDGEMRPAALNIVLSLFVGFGAAALGRVIGASL